MMSWHVIGDPMQLTDETELIISSMQTHYTQGEISENVLPLEKPGEKERGGSVPNNIDMDAATEH